MWVEILDPMVFLFLQKACQNMDQELVCPSLKSDYFLSLFISALYHFHLMLLQMSCCFQSRSALLLWTKLTWQSSFWFILSKSDRLLAHVRSFSFLYLSSFYLSYFSNMRKGLVVIQMNYVPWVARFYLCWTCFLFFWWNFMKNLQFYSSKIKPWEDIPKSVHRRYWSKEPLCWTWYLQVHPWDLLDLQEGQGKCRLISYDGWHLYQE